MLLSASLCLCLPPFACSEADATRRGGLCGCSPAVTLNSRLTCICVSIPSPYFSVLEGAVWPLCSPPRPPLFSGRELAGHPSWACHGHLQVLASDAFYSAQIEGVGTRRRFMFYLVIFTSDHCWCCSVVKSCPTLLQPHGL